MKTRAAEVRIGNVEGAGTWCDECQRETDHNGPWHREYLDK